MWTGEQIEQHKTAAKRLLLIKDAAFDYIKENKNITELEAQGFIYKSFEKHNLKTASQPLIVAFGEDSAFPHYYPTKKSNKKLKTGDVIKIDIWGKVKDRKAPNADITWMGYRGKQIPKKIKDIFNIVVSARDKGINYIKTELEKKKMPDGKEVDKIVRDYINLCGYGEKFIHGTGHSLGLVSPHGRHSGFKKGARGYICHNLGYTIEPGIYWENKFGIRSEINFYISDNFKLILTTPLQRNIVKI